MIVLPQHFGTGCLQCAEETKLACGPVVITRSVIVAVPGRFVLQERICLLQNAKVVRRNGFGSLDPEAPERCAGKRER